MAATELTLSPETLSFDTDTSSEQQITVTTNASDFTIEHNEAELSVTKETNLIKVTPIKGKVGTFNITIKAKEDSSEETSKTVEVTIVKATPEKPAAPVRENQDELQVNEGSEISIPFTGVEGVTLKAVSGKGTPTIEGNSVKFVAPNVDRDEQITITVTAEKAGLVSDGTEVVVTVKDVPEAPSIVEGDVSPKSLTGEEGTFQEITVTGDVETIEISFENRGIASSTLSDKTIRVSLTKEGSTNLNITLKKSGKTDKVIKVPVRVTKQGEELPEVPSKPIELPYEDLFIQVDLNEVTGKVNDKFKLVVDTNASEYNVVSDDEKVATFDKGKSEITLKKSGVANLTFKVEENTLVREVKVCAICLGDKPIVTALFNGVEYKFDNKEECDKFFESVRESNIPKD